MLGALVGATEEFCLLWATSQTDPVGTEILRVYINQTSELHSLAGLCGHVLPKPG